MKLKSLLIASVTISLLVACSSTPKPDEKKAEVKAAPAVTTATPVTTGQASTTTAKAATPAATASPATTAAAANTESAGNNSATANTANGVALTEIIFVDMAGVDPATATAVHFAFNSSAIDKSGFALVTDVATLLKANGSQKIVLQGNTDDRGSREYNLALGERRAVAVKKALQGLGVNGKLLETVSFGAEKPVDPAQTEAAWAKNRRVNFALAK